MTQPLLLETLTRAEKMLKDGQLGTSIMEELGFSRATLERIKRGEHAIQLRRDNGKFEVTLEKLYAVKERLAEGESPRVIANDSKSLKLTYPSILKISEGKYDHLLGNKYLLEGKKEEVVIPVTNNEGDKGELVVQKVDNSQREAAVIHTAASMLIKEYTRLTIAEHSDQRRIKTLCEELELYKIMEKESSDALTKLRDDSERTIANLNATIANLNHDLRKANEHGVEIGDLIPVETRDKVNLMLDQAEAIVG